MTTLLLVVQLLVQQEKFVNILMQLFQQAHASAKQVLVVVVVVELLADLLVDLQVEAADVTVHKEKLN